MSRRAGGSSLAKFRAHRTAALRHAWRDWVVLIGLIVGTSVGIVVTDGWASTLFAWTLGFACATALVGWLIGGDVHGLTWLWGSLGERDTAELLGRLGPEWYVGHDIEYAYGNWDHVLVGPPGVFVLDTKRLHAVARVANDELRSGRIRYTGASFRGSAVGLRDAIAARGERSPWVQSVVVVWGTLDEELIEENRVTYIRAGAVIRWLESLPLRLSANERARLTATIQALAAAPKTAPAS